MSEKIVPPFDLVFCAQDGQDSKIVFCLTTGTKAIVDGLSIGIEWSRHDNIDCACLGHQWAAELARTAAEAGLGVAFGEHVNGLLTFSQIEASRPTF